MINFINKIKMKVIKVKNLKLKLFSVLIILLIMLADLNPFFLNAGREDLVYTFENGVYKPFAFDNNLNTYSYYGLSWLGGHTAYCLDYSVKNAPNGAGLQYVGDIKSNKIVSVLSNGFPAKSKEALGVSTNDEAYLATQMAVWMAANDSSDSNGFTFDINKLQPNVKYSEEMQELFENSKKAALRIYETGYPTGSFSIDMSRVKVDYEYSKNDIKIGPYKPVSKGVLSVDKVSVTIVDPPKGTILVDKNLKEKSIFLQNEEFYVIVNRNEPVKILNINATGKANKNIGVVYGKGDYQKFVFLDTKQEDVKASATATWEESKGNIKIVKTDQDKKPVKDAEFALIDENGMQVKTGKTDANGFLEFNKLDIGNYTITEISVPDGYIIKKASYPVVVRRNNTTTVDVENTKVKGVLQIVKLEKNSKTPIPGVVFEIYDKNQKLVQTLTTDKDGIATSKDIAKGKYTFKEVSAPDGYIMDTNVYDFSITDNNNVVNKTVTNEKIVGSLEILKVDDEESLPLKDAEFEVYDSNKKLLNKVITDENGKAVVKGLAKGNYTFKEVKAPYGYDKDEKEYEFRIESLNQVVKQTITNKKVYGKLKIQKVDETNKEIANVKFEILDNNDKVIKTVVTDNNGIAEVQNLPIGKYKYREIQTPDIYVLDTTINEFEISFVDRNIEKKVVNKYAKGIIKIIKIDKDSKSPISNVKFNVIDKLTNEVVDTVVTDESGIARTKALKLGHYVYQEIDAPDEYILDRSTYEVKIKKHNEVIECTVANEHKKLPVTGGFLSTNILIVVIVTSCVTIVFVLYKLFKNTNKNSDDNNFNK